MVVLSISISKDQSIHCINDTHVNQGLIIDAEKIIYESRINTFVEKYV